MFSRCATVSRRAAILGRAFSGAARPAACKATLGLGAAAAAAATLGAAAAAATALVAPSTSLCHHDGKPVPHYGMPGTEHERTFLACKPDAVQRGLVGEVISRFEKKGYRLVAMKLIWPDEALASKHYADLKGRKFFPGLVKYFSSGPIVAMVWEGPGVILTGRKLLGATNPNDSAVGTIRGDFCLSVGRNALHGSDGPDSAKHEISMWFKPEEVYTYGRAVDQWIFADN